MPSITSANSIVTLAILGLFNTPQRLQQFSTDDVFGTDPLESAEPAMGVDGRLTAGFVFVPVKQTYSFMADSPSVFLFDQWFQTQQAQKDVFPASAVVILPSLRTKWALTRGFLTSYSPIPDAKKKLDPRKFGITWESVAPAPT